MRCTAMVLLTAFLMCAAWSTRALAHIEITYPPTRYAFEPPNSNNQKIGPCATGTPTGVVTELSAGQQIEVTWDEFIDHPGHFRIALDTTGADAFVDPASETDMAVTGNVVAYVPDTGGSAFSHTFTLPDLACEFCTIQIIQVMTDKLPWGPANGDDIYYWCSDISIRSDVGAGGSGAGGAGAGGEGPTATSGAGAGSSEEDDDGAVSESGCSMSGGVANSGGWFLILLLAIGWMMRRRSSSRQGIVLAALLLVTGCGGAQPASGDAEAKAPSGSRAADFTLATLDGGSITLSDYEGSKVVLVDFWATNCEPCKAEMPEIVKLYEARSDKGFEVLAVSIDAPETLASLSSYVQRFKMTFPVLLDHETEVFDRYSPKGTMPYTAVIDKRGTIVLRRSGYQAGDEASWQELVTTVDRALAE